MTFFTKMTAKIRQLITLLCTLLLALLLLNPLHATEPEMKTPKANPEKVKLDQDKAAKAEIQKAKNSAMPDSMDTYRVNVNRAGLDELQQLKGIGLTKAKAIIEYRENNGKIDSLDELTQVSGIGEKFIEQNADKVSF
jgi:competence protein ComEA